MTLNLPPTTTTATRCHALPTAATRRHFSRRFLLTRFELLAERTCNRSDPSFPTFSFSISLPSPNRMPLGWDACSRWAAGFVALARSSVTRCVRPCTSRTPRGAGSLATLGLTTRQALHWDTLAFRTTPRRRSVCATRPERADASRPIRRRATSPPAEVGSPGVGSGLLRRPRHARRAHPPIPTKPLCFGRC